MPGASIEAPLEILQHHTCFLFVFNYFSNKNFYMSVQKQTSNIQPDPTDYTTISRRTNEDEQFQSQPSELSARFGLYRHYKKIKSHFIYFIRSAHFVHIKVQPIVTTTTSPCATHTHPSIFGEPLALSSPKRNFVLTTPMSIQCHEWINNNKINIEHINR